jgi:glycerol-3-phosphate dehydrogenase (NAD(P)+)
MMMNPNAMDCCVVGAGAWGTAFAAVLARLGHRVTLAPRRSEHAAALAATRENADYLPGIRLPDAVCIQSDLTQAVASAGLVMLACPAQALRETSARLRPALAHAAPNPWVLSLAKGLELNTHLRPSQVMASELTGCRVGSLSGPTNAAEVARGLPAAVVMACIAADPELTRLQAALSGPTLRVYTGDDLPGIEYGGCLKNIYAIAAGCCAGLQLGDNARSALLTRALAEMVRVGLALGARAETFYGLSGFGDLVATCHGGWSRNRDFGQRLGEGATVEQLVSGRKTVVEGYRTTESFHGLCRDRGIDAPILTEIYRVCFEGKRVAEALSALMSRELKRE